VVDNSNCLWKIVLSRTLTQVANHFWSGGFTESDRQVDFYFCGAVNKASKSLTHTSVLTSINSEVGTTREVVG
jgi:hypothetical protein